MDNWVFAVHTWETVGDFHSVHWKIGDAETQNRDFKRWYNAFKFASRKAKELGLAKFQIDTPKEPHVFLNVDAEYRSPE